MKSLLLLFLPITLLFVSCEEVPPAIDFSKPIKSLKDSSYIASPVPAPQHKAVLIEDITGVRCSNCPTAAQRAMDIVAQKTPDSVIVIALYPIDIQPNNTNPWDNYPKLASEISKEIVGSLGIPQGLPSGYIDRKIFDKKTVRDISNSEWINYVNIRLKETTPVNIDISKKIKNRTLSVEIKLEYNAAVSVPHKYALYLLEDNIVSKQSVIGGEKDDYVHNHALRYGFGQALGNPLKGPNIAGKTYVKGFEYEIPAEYVIANCHLVCAVLDGTTEEVINVREIDL